MKKRFAKLIAISSILFLATGCGEQTSSVAENSSVVNPSSDVSTVVPDSSVALPDVTIKAAKDSYTIEKGGSTTIRFTVTSTAAKTLTFAVEQDKEIVSIPEDVAAGISVTVTGKAIGKATLVATSTVNPDSVARVSIEVVRPIAPLQSVWNKVIGFDNYTLDITRTPTNTELAEHDDWTEETAVPVSKVKTTADSIIYEVAGEVGDDLTTTYGPAYHSTQTGNSILGAAIDKNGYAFYLQQTAAGEFVTAGEVIKTSAGLLNSTNFKGAGVNATSPNGISDFFGLQAVNPSWLTAEKASSNVYELGGDDDKGGNPDFAECVLWQLVDPNGFMETVQSGVTSFADIADKVDVTITCTASDNLTISVDNKNVVYNVALTAVGTTAELTGLETFLATAEATMPPLPNALNDAVNAIKNANHNYVVTAVSRFGDNNNYFTEDYVYYDTSAEFAKNYNDYIDKNYPGKYKHLTAGGFGLVKKADGLHEFSYTPATYDDATGAELTPASLEIESSVFANSNASTNVYDIRVRDVIGYIETSDFFAGGYLYSLSSTATSVFNGLPDMYYVNNEETFQAMYSWAEGDFSSDQEDEHIAGVYVTYTKDEDDQNVVDTVNLVAAWGGDDGFYLNQHRISNFGKANENPVDALIKAALAA